jgi:hypothetical protein
LLFNTYFLYPQDKITEWVKPFEEVVSESLQLKYVDTLAEHMCELYNTSSDEIKYMAPLLLALKSLISADASLKN